MSAALVPAGGRALRPAPCLPVPAAPVAPAASGALPRGGSPLFPPAARTARLPLFSPSRPSGRPMRYFIWGDKGFAPGPCARWAHVVAGGARALPRRLCWWAAPAPPARPLALAGVPCAPAAPVARAGWWRRCAPCPLAATRLGSDRGKQLPDPSNPRGPDAAQTPPAGPPGGDAASSRRHGIPIFAAPRK